MGAFAPVRRMASGRATPRIVCAFHMTGERAMPPEDPPGGPLADLPMPFGLGDGVVGRPAACTVATGRTLSPAIGARDVVKLIKVAPPRSS